MKNQTNINGHSGPQINESSSCRLERPNELKQKKVTVRTPPVSQPGGYDRWKLDPMIELRAKFRVGWAPQNQEPEIGFDEPIRALRRGGFCFICFNHNRKRGVPLEINEWMRWGALLFPKKKLLRNGGDGWWFEGQKAMWKSFVL